MTDDRARRCGHPLGSTRWCPECVLAESYASGEWSLFPESAAATTSTAPTAGALTYADALAAIERVRPLLEAPDRLAEWMRAKGCDPALGGRLVLPEGMRRDWPGILPSYLSFSAEVREPAIFYGAGMVAAAWPALDW